MNRRLAHTLILGSIFTLLIAAIAVAWYTRERQYGIYSDDVAIYEEATRIVPRDILWQPAQAVKELADAGLDVFEPMVSHDGLSLFLVRGRPGMNADIYTASRTPDGWSEPTPLIGVNTDADELGPEMSADASQLLFYSDRDGGQGGYDIWVSQRGDDGAWAEAINLGANVNSSYNEYGLTVSKDGETIYFASNRPRASDGDYADDDAWPATLREERYVRDYDIYCTRLTDRGWSDPQPVDEVNSVFNDGSPALSPFGDFLYMSSDRPGGQGGYDIYRVRLHPDAIGRVERLDEAVNTQSNELDPTLAMGGYQLLFSSNRPGSAVALEPDELQRSPYQVYQSTSREVYMQYRTARAAIDWSNVLPWLFWILFTLMVLALLWLLHQLMKSEKYGKLSLLARCLLVSGIVHALIVLLLGLWGVGNSLMDWAGRERGMQVAISSPAVGDSLARQVRGELTSFEFNESFAVEATEQTPAQEIDASAVEMLVQRAELQVDRSPRAEMDDAAVQQPEVDLARTAADRAPAFADQMNIDMPEEAARATATEASVRVDPVGAALEQAATQIASEQFVRGAVVEVDPITIADSQQQDFSGTLAESVASMSVELPAADVQTALPPMEDSPAELNLPTAAARTANAEATLSVPQQASSQRSDAEPGDSVALASESSAVQLPAGAPGIPDNQRIALSGELAKDAAMPDVVIPDRTHAIAMRQPDDAVQIDLPAESQENARVDQEATLDSAADSLATGVMRSSASEQTVPGSLVTLDVASSRIDADRNADAVGTLTDSAAHQIDVPELPASGIALPLTDEGKFSDTSLPTDAIARDLKQEEHASSLPVAASMSPKHNTEHVQDIANETSDPSAATEIAQARIAAERILSVSTAHAGSSGAAAAPPVLATTDMALPAVESAIDDIAMPFNDAPAPASTSEAARNRSDVPASASMNVPRRARVEDEASRSATSAINSAQLPELLPDGRTWATPDLLMQDVDVRPESDPLADTSMVLVLDRSDAGLSDIELPTETQLPVDPGATPIGVLFGQVRDAMTGEMIPGAEVSLDLSHDRPTNAVTDEAGRYSMAPTSALPDFIAVSASKDGYIPGTVNVAAEAVTGEMYRLDFELIPTDAAVVILEADPQVHHLGDNDFSGRINSQFQKESEGLQYDRTFRLTREQIAQGEEQVEFRVLARGTQRDNPVRINGRQLGATLNNSPPDGSFGEVRIRFPKSWLRAGRNTVQINSVGRADDPDDFEFVNIRIFLRPQAVVQPDEPQRSR